MKKVVIGMSGGVDSSVAAAVLLEQGYEVIGVTMHLFDGGDEENSIRDAKKVCEKLSIPHYVFDFRKEFEENVISYFTKEYIKGRTPNPCIMCNITMKFDEMLKAADSLGADYIATGHYAKVIYDKDTDRYLLKKAESTDKDQSYVLFGLKQYQLKRVLMPLGDFSSKEEIRELAREKGLVAADRPDSQEICFIPDNDYKSFIEKKTGLTFPPGDFVDKEGNVLGKHQGIIRYTVGQRKGLGIAFGVPMFVTGIDAEKNKVILSEKGGEFSLSCEAEDVNFILFEKLTEAREFYAKIRYSAKEAKATVIPTGDNRVKVLFDTPQRAITPGQAVVFYTEDGYLAGGGIINKG